MLRCGLGPIGFCRNSVLQISYMNPLLKAVQTTTSSFFNFGFMNNKDSRSYPHLVDEQRIPGVYHCGHSEKTFGGASYFITRPEGNILVDSPKYTEKLCSDLKEMGGARFLFLTHRDDVADHEKWAKELDCTRILHSLEVNSYTSDVEMKLEGNGPWPLGSDVVLIGTPGHTKGSVSLFYKTQKVIFTGDHLMMDSNGLTISKDKNWYSVPLQLESVKKLMDWDFEWILPAHRNRAVYESVEDRNLAFKAFLAANGVQT